MQVGIINNETFCKSGSVEFFVGGNKNNWRQTESNPKPVDFFTGRQLNHIITPQRMDLGQGNRFTNQVFRHIDSLKIRVQVSKKRGALPGSVILADCTSTRPTGNRSNGLNAGCRSGVKLVGRVRREQALHPKRAVFAQVTLYGRAAVEEISGHLAPLSNDRFRDRLPLHFNQRPFGIFRRARRLDP